jgi:hypothetical protein
LICKTPFTKINEGGVDLLEFWQQEKFGDINDLKNKVFPNYNFGNSLQTGQTFTGGGQEKIN